MRAEIISVGTELLLGATVDTNSSSLGVILAECGIDCVQKQTVGDQLQRLSDAFKLAFTRADIVIAIGGLGPTMDDLTREGLADTLGLQIMIDPNQLVNIKELFESRKVMWVVANSRQAQIFEGAEFIQNERGSAPGIWWTDGTKYACLLPGPPREFNHMVNNFLKPKLLELSSGRVIFSQTVKVTGIGESRLAEILAEEMNQTDPTIAPYAKTAEVHLRVTSASDSMEIAQLKVEKQVKKITRLLGANVFGNDDDTLESAVIQKLIKQGKTLSTAESCTGGLLSGRITSVPGVSEIFLGGVVCYSEQSKMRELGVLEQTIQNQTAVSSEVAIELALGAKSRFQTDFALSITGVAGPGADSNGNPEGLVWIGFAHPGGVIAKDYNFGRGREMIRDRSVQNALTMLWLYLNERSV